MKKIITLLLLFFLLISPVSAYAKTDVLGVHILNPSEIVQARDLFTEKSGDELQWQYLTVPLSLADLNKTEEWRQFFQQARELHFIPIVRLVTRFEDGAWQIPDRKEITSYFQFLNQFEWPTVERYIIVFNEVNHAQEWGNSLDPAGYAEILSFTTDWAHSEGKNYMVLPAAMDLAAPNGRNTMEAFNFLEQMNRANDKVLAKVDYWNSHSYPNPDFSSSPTRTAQNSIRGFEHELSFVKHKTNRDFQVFITETGWRNTRFTERWLGSYYTYALQHVWSKPEVKGVTFFILKGDPGPFAEFGFFDRDNKPTTQFFAIRQAIDSVTEKL
ncbi:MAG: hypothetical protein COU63_00400 [Candidatus Pacebacteria bacterium CG10_big_fil_rev_8_21_14_0_10_36_11]|nr:hypothetical protein [Candidatus Pacearchaeota archaeon]OIP74215.1 MAG: hypothetical protein AUK08_03150 [Candidatus Pacebacteria bacterium CG2_30_36_39]PIR65118.1 MAG: hypothetical protein COU63_00400 [Candidatus Pacebacteria bacterium CG10_big_fil_rev_8_21_14_0_10_36_11]PJC42673.1 MAG: hypothetical protein CO040_03290 [Candidatus Pacebacteria bacterium CG_4_9_14_0_2_um_filter_36_8]